MTDDTRERFLRAITAQVPADCIAEVHLFRPLRRGMTETGVAVIAAERADMVRVSDSALVIADVTESETASSERSEAERQRGAELVGDAAREEAAEATHTVRADATSEGADEDSPYASDATVHAPVTAPERHTVFTARYRLTIKGAERGKWEFDVVADADAPLVTVDTVVRGVLRRAGDDEEPERLTADGVRAALDGQSWRPTA